MQRIIIHKKEYHFAILRAAFASHVTLIGQANGGIRCVKETSYGKGNREKI